MTVWAVVVAGGGGARFGRPKQFAVLAGRRVVDRSVDAARSVASGVVVVVPPGTPADEPVARSADVVVPGGATRSESVRAGLRAVPEGADVVVVHDAARPLAAADLFRAVVDAVLGGSDAAIPVVPVGDTVKRVHDGVVTATLDRDGLVLVQTPQAFRASALRRAHARGGDATDDAALVESAGGRVVVVPGDPRNFKITHPHDLAVAEVLLATTPSAP